MHSFHFFDGRIKFHNEEQVWCTHPCDNCDMFYLQYFHLTDPVHFGTQYNRNKAWTPNTSKMKIVKYVAVVQCWVIMFNTEKHFSDWRTFNFEIITHYKRPQVIKEPMTNNICLTNMILTKKSSQHINIKLELNLMQKQCFRMLWNKPICVSCFGNTILGRHK